MSEKASIMVCEGTNPTLEDDPEFGKGHLKNAKKDGFDKVTLTIEDTKTGEVGQIQTGTVSAFLGKFKDHFDDDFYNQFHPREENPGNHAHEIFKRIGRKDRLTIYYYKPKFGTK